VIELLLLGGAGAIALLVVAAVVFTLHQRRQGTVRAVFMPRRNKGGGAPEA